MRVWLLGHRQQEWHHTELARHLFGLVQLGQPLQKLCSRAAELRLRPLTELQPDPRRLSTLGLETRAAEGGHLQYGLYACVGCEYPSDRAGALGDGEDDRQHIQHQQVGRT